jgi:hypothetical protein
MPAADVSTQAAETWKLRRYDFIVQFAWKPTARSARKQESEKKAQETQVTSTRTE